MEENNITSVEDEVLNVFNNLGEEKINELFSGMSLEEVDSIMESLENLSDASKDEVVSDIFNDLDEGE